MKAPVEQRIRTGTVLAKRRMQQATTLIAEQPATTPTDWTTTSKTGTAVTVDTIARKCGATERTAGTVSNGYRMERAKKVCPTEYGDTEAEMPLNESASSDRADHPMVCQQ